MQHPSDEVIDNAQNDIRIPIERGILASDELLTMLEAGSQLCGLHQPPLSGNESGAPMNLFCGRTKTEILRRLRYVAGITPAVGLVCQLANRQRSVPGGR